MRIVIAGGGKIGRSLARLLSAEGYDLTVIDIKAEMLNYIEERYDVMTVNGNCAAMSTLREAGIEDADILIAATMLDEVNLLCCLAAHSLNKNLHTIARIRNPEYYEQLYELRDAFNLSMTFNPEFKTARDIARLLEYPGFLKRETFAKDRVEIVELLVDENSRLNGVKLADLPGIARCKVLVCAVVRSGSAFMPDGSFTLKSGDRVYVTAPTNELTALLKNLGIITKRVSRVLLAGGGRVSYYLAKQLRAAGISVRILEKDPDRCVTLAELLPDVEIVRGDATSQGTLEKEGALECDAVVSVTGLDEMNIIISLFAHDLGVKQVVTKVGRPESLSIVDRLEIGSAINPQEIIGSSVVRYVRSVKNQSGAALTVHSIASGMAEASEFLVDETTLHRGKPLRDIQLKKNVLLACISRHGNLTIPNGDSSFEEGDTLLIVTASNMVIERLNDIFE
ncbi:MAG: Trk system potassium transporter TrkA [Lachnospiraceae bacterium]|nr:Trk system potassium transporter TrkA [Lachnospiraceae bacterium]